MIGVVRFGRAIRPAYEGIETPRRTGLPPGSSFRRAIRPAYEGIETHGLVARMPKSIACVARSAPLMRGLKRYRLCRCSSFQLAPSRAIRPAYEGIETPSTTL